ncbi:MFS transporter [Hyalangium sp.]|uniref:MFS transporter n=1 Tax=Hyalangium sp. TaxID=2028555 RepID=UPI002D5BFE65|nr:MFS transporter [Hyalangium sp.]HYH98761.1 MFS transporter [Hyalangium sp.]
MNAAARRIQNVYLLLLLLHTLAASFIWGINTLFLLDAGLSNTEAFAANAFFTAGMVIFEVPTGVVADTRGRRTSYLLGTLTLTLSTLLYLFMWHVSAPFWAWALTSALLGLGFTFFSGAVEAWLVDALTFSGYFQEGEELESVLAKGKVVEGIAMLCGSVAGGVIAQATHLGVPYLLRALVLALSFGLAFTLMRDLGFTPSRGKRPMDEIKSVLRGSIEHGFANPPVRWIMLAAPFTSGVTLYAFYAMQPYLLQLYGNERAYAIAGLAAAVTAGAQIAGGLLVPYIGRMFHRRTSVLLAGTLLSTLVLAMIWLLPHFWIAIALLVLWALMFATLTPVRQAYLHGLIASKERATVVSFDSLMGSSGAVGIQPLLGRAADAWSYPVSFGLSAALQALAIPFVWLARRERAASDTIIGSSAEVSTGEVQKRKS